jgi:cold shock CspA family protein
MQGTISFLNRQRGFFFIAAKTKRGTGWQVDRFFSHLNRITVFECDESEVQEGCPVMFDIAPGEVPPGRERTAINITVYAKPSTAVMTAAATALSGQMEQKETVGGDL